MNQRGPTGPPPSQNPGETSTPRRPEALARALELHHVHELFGTGLTVVWKDDLQALEHDREILAALRAENFNLRLDVIFLRAEVRHYRRRLEKYRGW